MIPATRRELAAARRSRQQSDLHDVGLLIERRGVGADRQRDAELLPEALARPLHGFERAAEHVFGDDEPRVGRQQQAFGADAAVADVGAAGMD